MSNIAWNLGIQGSWISLRVVPTNTEDQGSSYDVVIDWGDEITTHMSQTLPKVFNHQYSAGGEYTITCTTQLLPYRCEAEEIFTSTFYIMGAELEINGSSSLVEIPSGTYPTISLSLSGGYDIGAGDNAVTAILRYGDGGGTTLTFEANEEQVLAVHPFTGDPGDTFLVSATLEDLDQSFGSTTMRVQSNVVTVQIV